jgi:hypothetical protein
MRRGCGLRRRFRTVVIHPVSDASYLLSINWRIVGLLLGHGKPTRAAARSPVLFGDERHGGAEGVALERQHYRKPLRLICLLFDPLR